MEPIYFESNYKKLGLLPLNQTTFLQANQEKYKPYIKILYLPEEYCLTVDFNQFRTRQPSLFFINSNQFVQLQSAGPAAGFLIYYNRDFYCIQMHDEEVACDGLLFNNVYQMPMTVLSGDECLVIGQAFAQIQRELSQQESAHEEMIRTYLKQVIIRATRLWKQQQAGTLTVAADLDLFRDFSRLVDIHYRDKHNVADYAQLLAVAPKTLSNKFNRLNLTPPNEIIKDRILLEAKRLLMYSSLSIKEIAYQLGYEDPAYFNRLFTGKTGETPAIYKKKIRQLAD
ncbi:helix-turn-helix domain-containing protein [Spirosoma sp. HMF4905]|uniref:Helix-turn-helix domain-containing protein n=1 Tax=Spirosoma arboris TaxID=2682092 RepID=A0A7K1SJD0_9BACT|nr:AraC family transcriptional regulator [Spirosoma arboris]MVM33917.1 helix-turn-helix domain-containing protein [Spirosoma arboris]